MKNMYGIARNALGTEKMIDARGTKDDLKFLFDKALRAGKTLPRIKMYCGTEDFLLPVSDSMAGHISEKLSPGCTTGISGMSGCPNSWIAAALPPPSRPASSAM